MPCRKLSNRREFRPLHRECANPIAKCTERILPQHKLGSASKRELGLPRWVRHVFRRLHIERKNVEEGLDATRISIGDIKYMSARRMNGRYINLSDVDVFVPHRYVLHHSADGNLQSQKGFVAGIQEVSARKPRPTYVGSQPSPAIASI